MEGTRIFIVGSDALKDAAPDALVGDASKEALHLIEPTAVRGGKACSAGGPSAPRLLFPQGLVRDGRLGGLVFSCPTTPKNPK